MSEEFSIPQEFYKFAVLVTIKVENISIFSILSSNTFSILDEKNIFDKYDIFWELYLLQLETCSLLLVLVLENQVMTTTIYSLLIFNFLW